MKITLNLNQSYELPRRAFEKWWREHTKDRLPKNFTSAELALDRAMRQLNWKVAVLTSRMEIKNGRRTQTQEIQFQ